MSKKGAIPVILTAVLVLVIAVGGVGIGLAWRTEYLDKWLPESVKEFFGKIEVSEEEPSDFEQGGEESEEEEPEAEVEEDPTADWMTYTNATYGYSIKYPKEWVYREYPTGVGAGFRRLSDPATADFEYITIAVIIDSLQSHKDMAFEDYAKIAATEEVQNFQSLNSIDEITTKSGLVGYKTTWNVIPMSGLGGTQVSEPITYFDAMSVGERSIQVSVGYIDNLIGGEQAAILDAYDQMISTFKFVE